MVWIRTDKFTPAWRKSVDLAVVHCTESHRRPGAARAVAKWLARPDTPDASAHYIVDNDEEVKCVSERNVAWAAPGANHNGIQIELVGYAEHTAEQWRKGAMLTRAAELVAGICGRWDIPVELLTSTELLGLYPFTGAVTPELTAWAQALLRSGKPIGTIETMGKTAARVEQHSWTWRDGKKIYGTFRGVTLYRMQKPRGIVTHASVSQAFKKSTHWDPGYGFPMGEFLDAVRRVG